MSDRPDRVPAGGETATDDSRPTVDTRSQLDESATHNPAEVNSRSRQHWYPAPSISYTIAVVESRRSWRRVRGQDFWLLFVGFGVLAALVSLPILFGRGQSVGEALAAGETPPDGVSLGVVAGWLGLFAFGAVAGVGSAGTLDQKPAVLTARPPKDAAGGLLLAAMAGYAGFAWLPALAAGSGIAVALRTPAPVIGILAGTTAVLLTAVTAGYACGLAAKGLIRRSPRLRRLKPVLGTVVVVGYVWSSTTGRLWTAVSTVSGVLVDSPLGWCADLTFLTTAGMNTSVPLAAGALLLTTAAVPLGVYATIRAGAYAWSVDATGTGTDTSTSTAPSADSNASTAGGARLARLLAPASGPATRGIAVAVIVRAYRNPLQLFYIAIPLVLAVPTVEPLLTTGTAPDWAPWLVVLFGAWAAGAAFPLNLLGNQGATLPALLTTQTRGRQVVAGHALASLVVFVPPTAAAGAGAAVLANRSATVAGIIAVASVPVLAAAAGLAAGIGAVFPRFSSIDLTGTTKARLPSRTAFALFSLAITVSVNAVGVVSDELYARLLSDLVSASLPGVTVGAGVLEPIALAAFGGSLLLVPAATFVGVRRVDRYQLD